MHIYTGYLRSADTPDPWWKSPFVRLFVFRISVLMRRHSVLGIFLHSGPAFDTYSRPAKITCFFMYVVSAMVLNMVWLSTLGFGFGNEQVIAVGMITAACLIPLNPLFGFAFRHVGPRSRKRQRTKDTEVTKLGSSRADARKRVELGLQIDNQEQGYSTPPAGQRQSSFLWAKPSVEEPDFTNLAGVQQTLARRTSSVPGEALILHDVESPYGESSVKYKPSPSETGFGWQTVQGVDDKRKISVVDSLNNDAQASEARQDAGDSAAVENTTHEHPRAQEQLQLQDDTHGSRELLILGRMFGTEEHISAPGAVSPQPHVGNQSADDTRNDSISSRPPPPDRDGSQPIPPPRVLSDEAASVMRGKSRGEARRGPSTPDVSRLNVYSFEFPFVMHGRLSNVSFTPYDVMSEI
jgi:hypothetical protein